MTHFDVHGAAEATLVARRATHRAAMAVYHRVVLNYHACLTVHNGVCRLVTAAHSALDRIGDPNAL